MYFYRLKHLLWLLILRAALPAGQSVAAESPLRWPLDLPTHYLTSGFMEHRPGRFHAGLDLKTRGKTGFPVYAVTDGSIVRVRATARAYGRAVYLQAADGTTYVYAHLGRFNDILRERIDAVRAHTGRYRVELYFKPGEIPVGQGEVLGLSGQSGTAGPHLHFEVRDAAQRPLDPLAHGFSVRDTIAPVISSIHAIGMTPAARAGGYGAIAASGQKGREALPDTLPPLEITGPVAFTARLIDHVDTLGYRLEPRQLTVTLDGEQVYRACNTTFSFDQGSRSRLEWYEGFSRPERWLHRRSGDDVPGREGGVWPLGPGGRGLATGTHFLTVEARDYAGNLARTVLPLNVVAAPRPTPGWRPDSLVVAPGFPGARGTTGRLNPFFAPAPASGWTPLDLDPRRDDPVLAPVRLWVRQVPLPPALLGRALEQHLEPTGKAIYVLAGDLPLASALQVPFPSSEPSPADQTRLRIFRWTGKKWTTASAVISSPGGRPGFKLTAPGLHAVMADTLPPRLTLPGSRGRVLAVGSGSRGHIPGVTLPRWEVFPVALREVGAGIDPASITATLDGQTLILEPDLPRSRLLVELPAATVTGTHELTVSVADVCGNRSSGRWTLNCQVEGLSR